MGGIASVFSPPSPPTAITPPVSPRPEPKPTRTKPLAETEEEARRRRVAGVQTTSGRASTLLSEVGQSDKLGA